MTAQPRKIVFQGLFRDDINVENVVLDDWTMPNSVPSIRDFVSRVVLAVETMCNSLQRALPSLRATEAAARIAFENPQDERSDFLRLSHAVSDAQSARARTESHVSHFQKTQTQLQKISKYCRAALFVRFNALMQQNIMVIAFFCVDLGVVTLNCGPKPDGSGQWRNFIDTTMLTSLAIVGSNGCGKSRFGKALVDLIQGQLLNTGQFISARRESTGRGSADDAVTFEEMCVDLADADAAVKNDRVSPLVTLMPFWGMVFKDINLSSVFDPPKSRKLMATRSFCQNHSLAPYEPAQLSDGEKGILMLLYHLFYPSSVNDDPSRFRVVVVDEPEAHLHPALVDQFWLAIERELPHILFVYISHDLSFASSRFHPLRRCLTVELSCARDDCRGAVAPQLHCHGDIGFCTTAVPLDVYDWGVADRVLGVRRQNILFVEGKSNSHDACLFASALRNWLVTPMCSKDRVYRMTENGNRDCWMAATNTHVANVFGLVDKDFGESVDKENVFCSDLAIVENLYATPEILALAFVGGNVTVASFKSAAIKLANERYDNQVAQYREARKGAELSPKTSQSRWAPSARTGNSSLRTTTR
jgi:energy-coupling factor transporter ATP-binding protein EcfA2